MVGGNRDTPARIAGVRNPKKSARALTVPGGFVATKVILRRAERDALDAAYRKLGLGNGAKRFDG